MHGRLHAPPAAADFQAIVRAGDSVVDAIVEVALDAAVDLIVIGEPVSRGLDRGGGRRIVHEVAERLPPTVRVVVIPTVLPPTQRLGRALSSKLANHARLTGSASSWDE